jgi:hypothetical protein
MGVVCQRCGVTLVFALLLSYSANAQSWCQAGPPLGYVQSYTAISDSTGTPYPGTSDRSNFSSRDAGGLWRLLGSEAGSQLIAAAVDFDAGSADGEALAC